MILYILYAHSTFVASHDDYTHVATLIQNHETSSQEAHDYLFPIDILDRCFRQMNVVDGASWEVPQKIQNRSMCVGDIVILHTSPSDKDRIAYRCDACGWTKLTQEEHARAITFLLESDKARFLLEADNAG